MALPVAGERTGAQVVRSFSYFGVAALPPSYATYRKMRKHPTVAMGRALAAAPILAGQWAVESDNDAPEAWDRLVKDQVVNRRHEIVEHAVTGSTDYGFAPFEKVWVYTREGLRLAKVKGLLQDPTRLLGDPRSGSLAGLRQKDVVLGLDKAMVLSFRVEGTNWYGQALLENVRDPWNDWMECNAGARRYDAKVAGALYVVKYPLGKSPDERGAERDNLELAQEILAALQSSGSVCIPNQSQDIPTGPAESNEWKIELLQDSGGRQPTFRDRLEYLDKLIARGLLLPERAFMEGSHGTLAEAEAHEDVALVNAELTHQSIVRQVNEQLVDPLLTYNYGEAARGKVRLTPAPLSDKTLSFLREVYRAFLTNPSGFLEEYAQIDTDALKDKLGVPKSQEVADAGSDGPVGLVRPGVDPYAPEAAATRAIYREMGR
ncbi:MAG: hypothetical protein JW809_19355 [Pirellulales bacterium]|nr:hypothetical protein [Pirellulales bacterium]